MLLAAADRFGLDMRAYWMIGDRPSDLEAAVAAGVAHTRLLEQADGVAEITREMAEMGARE